jgi:hypothetical protein
MEDIQESESSGKESEKEAPASKAFTKPSDKSIDPTGIKDAPAEKWSPPPYLDENSTSKDSKKKIAEQSEETKSK